MFSLARLRLNTWTTWTTVLTAKTEGYALSLHTPVPAGAGSVLGEQRTCIGEGDKGDTASLLSEGLKPQET